MRDGANHLRECVLTHAKTKTAQATRSAPNGSQAASRRVYGCEGMGGRHAVRVHFLAAPNRRPPPELFKKYTPNLGLGYAFKPV